MSAGQAVENYRSEHQSTTYWDNDPEWKLINWRLLLGFAPREDLWHRQLPVFDETHDAVVICHIEIQFTADTVELRVQILVNRRVDGV